MSVGFVDAGNSSHSNAVCVCRCPRWPHYENFLFNAVTLTWKLLPGLYPYRVCHDLLAPCCNGRITLLPFPFHSNSVTLIVFIYSFSQDIYSNLSIVNKLRKCHEVAVCRRFITIKKKNILSKVESFLQFLITGKKQQRRADCMAQKPLKQ